MKILIVDSLFAPLGGGQIIAYNTYNLLKQHGHKCYYWAMDKKDYFDPKYEYLNYFTQYYSGVKDYIRNPVKYYYNYRALKDLQTFVNFIEPDIVHYQSFWGLSSAIFKVKTNAKKILTIHDARCCPAITLMYRNKRICQEQYCKKMNFLPCILHKCAKNSYEASIRAAFQCLITTKNFNYIDKFITPSDALCEKMLNADIGIEENKITTINNFLTKDFISMRKPKYINNSYFLYVGRLDKEKNVISLLQAMKGLPRNINLIIAGSGPEEEYLKNFTEKNNLENVKFLGFVNRDNINELYQNCIATILPCNWFEIFGMTNIEAMINGKPVIASNVGGIPEIVEHNKTGVLFEPANVEQLKECILYYWNNPDKVIEHGKRGYEKAIKQYTEERYYQELMQVYEEVLNEKQYRNI